MITEISVTNVFKSIKPFKWENIPKLVIITGVNGVGKSQFIETIYNSICKYDHSNISHRSNLPPAIVNFTTDGIKPSYYTTFHAASFWEPGSFSSVSRANLDNTSINFVNWIKGKHKPNPEPEMYKKLKAEIETNQGKKIESLSEFEIANSIPYDFVENHERVAQNTHLSEVFLGYISRSKQLVYEAYKVGDTISNSKILERLGEAPWEKINRAFEKNGFSYRVNYPDDDLRPFQCKFQDANRSTGPIDFADLSSGEKMIVTFILWSYNEKISSINNLFLMDEPDAHLHPSMIRLFLKIISETLVGEYGMQVIITTHNPSTVALAPESSLFIMNKDGPERIKKASKLEALSKLTENLLLVTTAFRVILVEDKNDVSFYETIYNELIALGKLENNPPLVFKPASNKDSSGGNTVVKAWIEKFNESGPRDSSFKNFLYGMIDSDGKNTSSDNLHVTLRYSIENYLLDPILIFSALLLNDDADAKRIAAGTKYTKGNLSELYKEDSTFLNKIAGEIFALAKAHISPGYSKTSIEVEFINGIKLDYPEYLLKERGHDLYSSHVRIFKNLINYDNLIQAMAITRFIPKEFLETYSKIKS